MEHWKSVKKIFLYVVGLTADIQIGDLSNSKKENVLISL
jgi:hypothetical protein